MSEKFYITTAIDYINAKPHIGHAYEKVAADVLARFYAGKIGRDRVRFLTGTDEHGAKIVKAAETANQPIEEFARETAAKFSFAWDQLGIQPDRFIRTTDKDHIETVKELLLKIKANGNLEEGFYEGYYCTSCEAFYTETETPDHICPIHKTLLELIKEKNWFLQIRKFTGQIEDAIKSNKLEIWPTSARHEILTLLKKGFTNISISRPNVKWGIPLPWDESQTVYVWVDALINYLTGAKSEQADWWPADIHVIGKDISKFHCIIWPALLLAAGYELPKKIVVHGYLTIGGEKISKSTGNVIDPNDWVAKYGADAVRYFLLKEIPFGEDGDVSEEKLISCYQADLANGFGNLVSRVLTMAKNYKVEFSLLEDGQINNQETYFKSQDENYQNNLQNYEFRTVLLGLRLDLKYCDDKIAETEPFKLIKTKPDEAKQVIRELIRNIHLIAWWLKPFMPETSEKILQALKNPSEETIPRLFPRIQ